MLEGDKNKFFEKVYPKNFDLLYIYKAVILSFLVFWQVFCHFYDDTN